MREGVDFRTHLFHACSNKPQVLLNLSFFCSCKFIEFMHLLLQQPPELSLCLDRQSTRYTRESGACAHLGCVRWHIYGHRSHARQTFHSNAVFFSTVQDEFSKLCWVDTHWWSCSRVISLIHFTLHTCPDLPFARLEECMHAEMHAQTQMHADKGEAAQLVVGGCAHGAYPVTERASLPQPSDSTQPFHRLPGQRLLLRTIYIDFGKGLLVQVVR